MPISIRQIAPEGEDDLEIACLGDNEWSLPQQIELLASWIESNANALPRCQYIADVGFCLRRDAGGGGSALAPDLLSKMGAAGFSLFLSEYPGFADHTNEEAEQAVGSNGGQAR